jgi:hypothetical protein
MMVLVLLVLLVLLALLVLVLLVLVVVVLLLVLLALVTILLLRPELRLQVVTATNVARTAVSPWPAPLVAMPSFLPGALLSSATASARCAGRDCLIHPCSRRAPARP